MNSTTSATVIAHVDPALLSQLAEFPDGWASAPQIAWTVASADSSDRRDVYLALKRLGQAGIWQCIEVRHNDGVMYAYRTESAAIQELLAEVQ
jgi:hypothetical protein